MGVEYKVFKRGAYWFAILSIEAVSGLFLLLFMKGNTFSIVQAVNIPSEITNYKERLNDNSWKNIKEEIIEKNNYLKNVYEVEITNNKIPLRLVSKIIKLIEEKVRNLTTASTL